MAIHKLDLEHADRAARMVAGAIARKVAADSWDVRAALVDHDAVLARAIAAMYGNLTAYEESRQVGIGLAELAAADFEDLD